MFYLRFSSTFFVFFVPKKRNKRKTFPIKICVQMCRPSVGHLYHVPVQCSILFEYGGWDFLHISSDFSISICACAPLFNDNFFSSTISSHFFLFSFYFFFFFFSSRFPFSLPYRKFWFKRWLCDEQKNETYCNRYCEIFRIETFKFDRNCWLV